MKTKLLGLLLAGIILAGICFPIIADQVGDYNYNIVLLIDKSGSMNATDKNGISKDAAVLFINNAFTMCGASRLVGNDATCYIGAIAFDSNVTSLSAPLDIGSQINRDTLCDRINGIKYGKGGTDLGKALKEAVNMLENSQKPNYKSMVVLLTDGYIDGKNVDAEKSEEMIAEAIESAKIMDCEILAVGLNANGKIKEQGRRKIWQIADETQIGEGFNPPDSGDANAKGYVNYAITEKLSEIESFYTGAIAKMFGINPEIIPGEIKIEGRVIVMINIYTNPENSAELQIGDIRLTRILDNDDKKAEKDVTFTDAVEFLGTEDYDKIDYSVHDAFSLIMAGKNAQIMMVLPLTGLYKLYLPEGIDYKAYMMQIVIEEAYTAECSTDVEINKCNVICKLRRTDEAAATQPDYNSLSVHKFEVYYEDAAEPLNTYSLNYDSKLGCFTGEFPADKPGKYTVKAIAGDEISTICAESTAVFKAYVSEDDVKMDDVSVIVKKSQKVSYPEGFYAGWDNVEWWIESVVFDTDEIAKAEFDKFDKSGVTVTGLKPGKCHATVNVGDDKGMSWQFEFNVEVKANLLLILLLIGGGIAVAVIVIIIIMRSTKKITNGSFRVAVTTNVGETLFAADDIDNYPSGCQFSLYKLLKKYQNVDGSDELAEVFEKLNNKELKKKVIILKKNKNAKCNSYYCGRSDLFDNPTEIEIHGKNNKEDCCYRVEISWIDEIRRDNTDENEADD